MDDKMVAKLLNMAVMGENFVNKDLDNYLYASLSQPPIKIINKNNSDDECDYTVECPNCHKEVIFGDTCMLDGYIYCSEKCREKLLEENYYLRRKYQ